MELFPTRFLSILDVLDEESACVVVVNNVAGLTAAERKALRASLVDKNEALIQVLNEFKTNKDHQQLFESLRKSAGIEEVHAPELKPTEVKIST